MLQANDLVPEWRGAFANEEVNRLHGEAFGHALSNDDWWAQVNRHSLGWICLRSAGRLVGFVNVAWDGGVHAFLLDTMIAVSERRKGSCGADDQTRRRGSEKRGLRMAACRFHAEAAGVLFRRVRFSLHRCRRDRAEIVNAFRRGPAI